MTHNLLEYVEGKRKFLFCADSKSAETLHDLVHHAMEKSIPFDFHIFEDGHESLLGLWLNQQKMGTYLYISGKWDFVKHVKNLAYDIGFSDYEMQTAVIGTIKKKLVCCTCHGENDVENQIRAVCAHCGQELEVSSHYSRRLDAYLGYVSIKS